MNKTGAKDDETWVVFLIKQPGRPIWHRNSTRAPISMLN